APPYNYSARSGRIADSRWFEEGDLPERRVAPAASVLGLCPQPALFKRWSWHGCQEHGGRSFRALAPSWLGARKRQHAREPFAGRQRGDEFHLVTVLSRFSEGRSSRKMKAARCRGSCASPCGWGQGEAPRWK